MSRAKAPYIAPAERAAPDLDSGKYLVMWQGPNHPGITGNMSLRLVIEGDSVVDCETHVGYLHRGFEKLMERRLWMQNFPLVCRIAVPEPDFNEYCYAAALEELAGIEVPDKAVWLRTLSLEMIRLASFLMWIGGQAGAFGHGTIAQWSVTMRDYVLDLFEELTGGRIYHMYIIPGGVRGDVPAGFLRRVLETMDTVRKNLDDIELVMFHNVVYKMRAQGLGYIPPDWVDQYGITGPNARAAGLPRDLRKDLGYLAYPRLSFEPIVGAGRLPRQAAQPAALEDSGRRNLRGRGVHPRRVRLLRGIRRRRQAAPGGGARPQLHARRGADGAAGARRQHRGRGRPDGQPAYLSARNREVTA